MFDKKYALSFQKRTWAIVKKYWTWARLKFIKLAPEAPCLVSVRWFCFFSFVAYNVIFSPGLLNLSLQTSYGCDIKILCIHYQKSFTFTALYNVHLVLLALSVGSLCRVITVTLTWPPRLPETEEQVSMTPSVLISCLQSWTLAFSLELNCQLWANSCLFESSLEQPKFVCSNLCFLGEESSWTFPFHNWKLSYERVMGPEGILFTYPRASKFSF